MKIAVYTIALNEEWCSERWATSTVGADVRVVLDTGSSDRTVEVLRDAGVTVHQGAVIPFRFDIARNSALALVPADVDICVSLDMDELLDDGFLPALRAAWAEQPFDSAMTWIDTGSWWKCHRVHSRQGWRWFMPCHEVMMHYGDGPDRRVDIDTAKIYHRPNAAPRTNRYRPLLEMAVHEQPSDGRAWTYLTRECFFQQDRPALLEAAEKAVELGGWAAERAAVCRWAAWADPNAELDWLQRGVETAPGEAEAWHALATYQKDRDWQACFDAAVRGLQCSQAAHYLADQGVRAWGLHDLAALAAHFLGDPETAIAHGEAACAADPSSGRLTANLYYYRGGVAPAAAVIEPPVSVPTFAIVPAVAGEREEMTAALIAALDTPNVLVDWSDLPIYEKWNRGLQWAEIEATGAGHSQWNVAILNNDLDVDAGFLDGLAASLRATPDVRVACPDNPEGFVGWAFMLRGEDGYRIDPQYEWWCGDTDLCWQVRADGGRVVTSPATARHLHPNESTFYSSERLAMARRDEARFAAKWEVDPATLFLARNPVWWPTAPAMVDTGAPVGRLVYVTLVADRARYDSVAMPGILLAGGADPECVMLEDAPSAAKALNGVLDRYRHDATVVGLVVLHEDCEITDEHFEASVRYWLNQHDVGIVGAIGADSPPGLNWWDAAVKHGAVDETRGRIAFDGRSGEVDVVDGLLMVIGRAALDAGLRYDEDYDAFHGYDLDLCMQARAAGLRVVVANVGVNHRTKTGYGDVDAYGRADALFRRKWHGADADIRQ